MKILSLITILLSIAVNAQTIKASYVRYLDMEEANKTANTAVDKAIINDLALFMKPTNFIFLHSNNQSIYKEVKEENSEPELNLSDKEMLFNKISEIEKEPFEFYKDFNSQHFLKQNYLLGKLFLVNGNLQILNWQITDKTEQIGDFKCKIATAIDDDNRPITAYYTEDIPISDGPDQYCGLPGLILKVKISANYIELTQLSLIDENTEIIKPNKGKKVAYSEYMKILQERMRNNDFFDMTF